MDAPRRWSLLLVPLLVAPAAGCVVLDTVQERWFPCEGSPWRGVVMDPALYGELQGNDPVNWSLEHRASDGALMLDHAGLRERWGNATWGIVKWSPAPDVRLAFSGAAGAGAPATLRGAFPQEASNATAAAYARALLSNLTRANASQLDAWARGFGESSGPGRFDHGVVVEANLTLAPLAAALGPGAFSVDVPRSAWHYVIATAHGWELNLRTPWWLAVGQTGATPAELRVGSAGQVWLEVGQEEEPSSREMSRWLDEAYRELGVAGDAPAVEEVVAGSVC